ncbi:hypothetical protein PUR71_37750 [Streptomyces sp. SP17BM10]|uniref:hypothetical protein n=1 Tax=Streptomyces sp. SP17BM10 TaxID=3002530 RepID=UPI002E790367|nr:hypothetical protein [Streptomyces sp. SP17BM10]MEE1788606.1 hypothetical protein [Streptomyces sp. SP17BM10]
MPYEAGTRIRLTREAQVTAGDSATRGGVPGPLFLAEGLAGTVMGSTTEGGRGQDHLASFDQHVRGHRFDAFAASLIDDLRQNVARLGAFDAGAGARTTYRVRFDNGFVLDGLEEGWLTQA